MFQGVGGFRGMFVADLGGEVAMGLRRLPTLANHCAQRASVALLQGKWIEIRELTYKIALLVGKVQRTLNFPYIVNCNSSPTPDLKTLTRDPPRFLRSGVS